MVAGRDMTFTRQSIPGLLMPMQDADPYDVPGFALGEVDESAALPG